MKLSQHIYGTQWRTDSLESIWGYLIENGDVDPKQDTERCLKDIKEIGISWEYTKPPYVIDRQTSDYEKEVVLEGHMIMNNCSWYKWYLVLDPPKTTLNSHMALDAILEYRLKEVK